MTGNEQSQLRFDISENVTFHHDQPRIDTLLSLDLTPEVRIEDLGSTVRIEGAIRLSGKYLSESDETSQQHTGRVAGRGDSDEELAGEEIQYVIPVEITLPSERAGRLEDITAEIKSFDYELLSGHELTIEALLVVDGLQLPGKNNATTASFGEQDDGAFIRNEDDTKDEEEQLTDFKPPEWIQEYESKQGDETWQGEQFPGFLNKDNHKDKDGAGEWPGISEPFEASLPETEFVKYEPSPESEIERRHTGKADHFHQSEAEQKRTEKTIQFENNEPSGSLNNEQQGKRQGEKREGFAQETPEIQVGDETLAREEPMIPVQDETIAEEEPEPQAKDETPTHEKPMPPMQGETADEVSEQSKMEAPPPSADDDQADHTAVKQETKIHFQKMVEKKPTEAVSLNDLLKDEESQADVPSHAEDAPGERQAPRDESKYGDHSTDESSSALSTAEESEADEEQLEEAEGTVGIEWMKQKLGGEENRFHRLRMVLVQKEETLENIADRYDLSSVELLKLNKLESGDLEQGQIIYLPDRD